MFKIDYLPLHIKTAVLASLISLVVLAGGLIVVSASIAKQIQSEQKELAALGAENLAEELSATQAAPDSETLKGITNVLGGSRPSLLTVRVWTFENGQFVETAASDDSLPVEELSGDVRAALQQGVSSSSVKALQNEDESYFRVLSPIVRGGRLTGAVEAVEKLDTISSITIRYATSLSWITLATVFFMTVAFYLMFQKLVYQPLAHLLGAMAEAKAGNLSAAVPDGRDEFGRLAGGFNAMMTRLARMTSERERRNEILRERVNAATAELSEKNDQIETANLELFRTTRKMAEMERLAAAGQTAAEFAHEVGTPLNLISGHIQILQTGNAAGTGDAERLNIITTQIERIESIVRRMLDRTRFGGGHHSPVDLNDLLRKTASVIEPTMEEGRIGLSVDLAEEIPHVFGDADRLQQVFLNLINNAIDAMPGGGELRISTAARDDGKIIVELADTGSGMSDEVRTKIFQPLFTTKERGRGTGLGLFVVQQILQEHAVEVAVESTPSNGTTFRLIFPAAAE